MNITHEAFPQTYGVCTAEQFRLVWEPKGWTEITDDEAAKRFGPNEVASGAFAQDPASLDGDALRDFATTLGVEFSARISDDSLRERVAKALGSEPDTAAATADGN